MDFSVNFAIIKSSNYPASRLVGYDWSRRFQIDYRFVI
jgi:hypothetical protein